VKTSKGKVVATSFPYPITVHISIAGDVPIYLKLAPKMMHPFRKLRKTVHDIQLFLVSRDRDFTFGPVRELWPNRTNRNDN